MEYKYSPKEEQLLRRYSKMKRWQKTMSVLGCLVVFITTYALILPAITMIKSEKILTCPVNVHRHSEVCYNEDHQLTCGFADFVVHTHTEDCYDKEGNIQCELPEIQAHVHDESCYQDELVLVCDPAEYASEGHHHTDACYSTPAVDDDFIEVDENGSFVFSDFNEERELICGQEETEVVHEHTDACYEVQRKLICNNAAVLHKHDPETCYEQIVHEDGSVENRLICTELQVLEHKHEDGCFTTVTREEADEIRELEEQENPDGIVITDAIEIEIPEEEIVDENTAEEITDTEAEEITEEISEDTDAAEAVENSEEAVSEETAENTEADVTAEENTEDAEAVENAEETETVEGSEETEETPDEITSEDIKEDNTEIEPVEENSEEDAEAVPEEETEEEISEADELDLVDVIYILPGEFFVHVGDTVQLMNEIEDEETYGHTWTLDREDFAEFLTSEEENSMIMTCLAPGVVNVEHAYNDEVIDVYTIYIEEPEEIEETDLAFGETEKIYEGSDYTVTVRYSETAEIPEDAELQVTEIPEGSEEYQMYYDQAIEALSDRDSTNNIVSMARFFDISFVYEDMVIEPSDSVNVSISYHTAVSVKDNENASVVHFAEEGVEVLKVETSLTEDTLDVTEIDTFSFVQDSFSVTGTLVTAGFSANNDYLFIYSDGTNSYAIGHNDNNALTWVNVSNYVTINNGNVTLTDDFASQTSNILWKLTPNGNSYFYTIQNKDSERYLYLANGAARVQNIARNIGVSSIGNNQIRLSFTTQNNYTYFMRYENNAFTAAAGANNALPLYAVQYVYTEDTPEGPDGGSGGSGGGTEDIVKPEISHTKYISEEKPDNTYDLSLTVSATVGSDIKRTPLDLLLVIDTSGSMTGNNNYNEERLTDARNAANTLVNTLASNKNLSVTYDIVTFNGALNFYGGGSINDSKASGWMSDGNTTLNYIQQNVQQTNANATTNYEAAFERATNELANHPQSDAQTILVFLTDGDPTISYSSSYPFTTNITQAQVQVRLNDALDKIQLINTTHFYAVGIGEATRANLVTVAQNVTATTPMNSRVLMSDVSSLAQTFLKIAEEITKISIKDVVILDTLSDEVELISDDLTITITDKAGNTYTGTNTIPIPGTSYIITSRVFIDERTGDTKIEMKFPAEYELEEGWTYIVTSQIKPTQAAYDRVWENNGYPDIGDAGTDEPGSGNHSSSQLGVFSNKFASVEYTIDEEEHSGEIQEIGIDPYDKPVVQLHLATLIIEKNIEGLTDDQIDMLRSSLVFNAYDLDEWNMWKEWSESEEAQDGSSPVMPMPLPILSVRLDDDEFVYDHLTQKFTYQNFMKPGTRYHMEENGELLEHMSVQAEWENQEGTFEPDKEITVRLTNIYEPRDVDVILEKGILNENVGEGQQPTLLGNAGFHLTKITQREDGTEVREVVSDENNVPIEFITDDFGSVVLPSLDLGPTFMLEEVRAPLGYELLKDPVYFQVTKSGISVINPSDAVRDETEVITVDGDTITIHKIRVLDPINYELPHTGGLGSLPYTLGGAFLVGISLMFGFSLRHKQERRFR